MGVKLIVEVLDHAPADLTSGERLTLIVIAEWANDGTREARQTANWTIDTIVHRAGIKRTGLKAIFQGLARKGCEVRVPIKVDKNGKPVYAFEGKAMQFRVPKFSERGCHSLPSEETSEHPHSIQEGMPQHPRGEAVASQRGGHSLPLPLSPLKEPLKDLSLGDRPSVPAPREPVADDRERDDEDASLQNTEPLSVAQQTLADEGVNLAEADLLIPVIEATNKVRSPAFWRHVAKNRDIVQILAAARALLTEDNCPRCSGTAEIEYRDQWDNLIKKACSDCSDPDHPPARCPDHPSYPARTCSACRADRLAKGLERPRDQQSRSGERGGYQAQTVNHPPGHRQAGWDARRQQHHDEVPPGYKRRPDGSLVLVNSRDPRINWDADLFNRTETTS